MADTQYFSRGRHSGPMDYLKDASQIIDPRKSALPYALIYASTAGAGGPALSALPSSTGASALTSAAAPAGASLAAGAGAGGGAAAGTGGVVAGLTGAAKYLQMAQSGISQFANARSNNRATDAYYDQQDQNYDLDRANTELNQRRYLDENYDRNVRRSAYGGLLQGAQDVNVQAPEGIPMGTVTGGLRPSAIQGRQELGRSVQSRAMEELIGGGAPAQIQPYTGDKKNVAQVQAYFDQMAKANGITGVPTAYYAQQAVKEPDGVGDGTFWVNRMISDMRVSSSQSRTGGSSPLMTLPARSSSLRQRPNGVDTGLGVAASALPFVSSLLGDYRRRSVAPTVSLAGNSQGYMS